jgi:hypothetical protein
MLSVAKEAPRMPTRPYALAAAHLHTASLQRPLPRAALARGMSLVYAHVNQVKVIGILPQRLCASEH